MTILNRLILILTLPITLVAQYRGGCSVTSGIGESIPFSFSVSYLQPVLLSQVYVQGGYRYFQLRDYNITDITYSPFKFINQAQLGIFLGDYLFANPKVTCNWYGKERSFGWAITGGMMWHPFKQLSLGIAVGYDQFHNQIPLDPSGVTSKVSFSLIGNVHPFK